MGQTIAVIGGTGPEGLGLATRFVIADHTVVLGSRDAERGARVAGELADRLSSGGHANAAELLSGTGNVEAAAGADLVIVAVPHAGHRATVKSLRSAVAGKIVVDAVVPVIFEKGPRRADIGAGSMAEETAELLPESRVVGAFHEVAADILLEPDTPVNADILVTGGDAEAKRAVIELAGDIEGARGIDAGPLRFSRAVEDLAILLIGINGRYHARSGVRIAGLPGE
jgi:NADPH-dependent F420 reductase